MLRSGNIHYIYLTTLIILKPFFLWSSRQNWIIKARFRPYPYLNGDFLEFQLGGINISSPFNKEAAKESINYDRQDSKTKSDHTTFNLESFSGFSFSRRQCLYLFSGPL